ncbi:hypothetical protein BDV35DRAFT_379011 [Aspergillus flavus]|uniref:Major facilitator superfamily (MFS) profile domain-containing protein n=1 Tax=Aspergillus flavus TaxID=5059 RepID=A0A5N6H750_ASPFL|nr:hypothetical protein BDV35DRAFT_379011 [Aspergillus flavus]
MSAMEQEDKHPSPDVRIATGSDQSSEYSKRNDNGIVLIPQPSDDPEDPLNWPMRKKIIIFACICLAGFAGQMSPNSNQLTFVYQIPAYHKTQTDLLNSVAAGLAGWVAGPFFIIPLVAVIGRSSVVLWSLVAIFACQIWAAEMTGANDYISFTISRLFCGMFGGIPAILGSGYIMDMFYLHQRGKAFAIFEVLIIFAVVGGGTLGGFIAEHKPWNYVFWWTLGPVGAAILAVFFFVEDTTFPRDPSMPKRAPLPKGWFANRIATFLPGTKTQPSGKGREFVRKAITPLQITFTPITLLTGTYIFIALGLPIMQASTLATYLEPPEEAGGYGFSSLQMAFFTMTAWVGIISAQVYGFFFNDKTPLWLARRRGGTWHTEYRLANTILPSIILPIGLGIYGAGLEYHLHFMVLALGSFLIWFGALLALPVCYNYIIECFLNNPVEASVSLNAYRVSFGLMSVFIVTQWQSSVGVGWMWGMGAFLIVFVDLIMAGIILKGHLVRKWTATLGSSLDVTEDGANISAKKEGGVGNIPLRVIKTISNTVVNIKMKIQLFWFLTTTSLVFAGFNRRATLRDGIERRGDVYNQCVLSIIKEGTEKAEQAVPAVEECIKRFEKSIEESCLAPYTDQDQDARTKNMNSCFNVQGQPTLEQYAFIHYSVAVVRHVTWSSNHTPKRLDDMPAVNKKPNLSSFACSALSSTMRLIHTERLQLEEFADEIPPYAVLSHRWGKDEVTFQDILLNQNHDTEGYRKVENICKVANQDGFEYAWIDTCCINKESSAELSEAINSMFRWYESAGRCYAYLRDVSPDNNQSDLSTKVRNSVYFKRGWTLQELIAPSDLHLPLYHSLVVKDVLILECQDTSLDYIALAGIYLLPSHGGQLQYMRYNSGPSRVPLWRIRHVKAQTIYVMKTSIGEGGSSLLHERKPYRYTESRLRGEISQSGERPKKVILCFDGGNHKHGANHQSNIEKIHKMLYGTNGSQLCYYQRANFSRPDDFKTCMGDGYSWLVDHYNIGDEIFLFGFSSGAYIAQALARMVDYIGVLPEINGGFQAAWDIYQSWNNYALRTDADKLWEERESYFQMKGFREKLSKPTNRIPFLGLFDAVVVKSKYLGREGERISTTTEISKSASTICHAVSIDECRAELRPVLLNEELGSGLLMKGLKQVWFPGSHADIGGLVPLDPDETYSLSHIPLVWMVCEATNAGLSFRLTTQFGCDEHTQVSPLDLTKIMGSDSLSDQYNAFTVSPGTIFSSRSLASNQ